QLVELALGVVAQGQAGPGVDGIGDALEGEVDGDDLHDLVSRRVVAPVGSKGRVGGGGGVVVVAAGGQAEGEGRGEGTAGEVLAVADHRVPCRLGVGDRGRRGIDRGSSSRTLSWGARPGRRRSDRGSPGRAGAGRPWWAGDAAGRRRPAPGALRSSARGTTRSPPGGAARPDGTAPRRPPGPPGTPTGCSTG